MPLNSIPPTTTVANLEEKRRAARDQCWADIGFWGGVIPGNKVGFQLSAVSPLQTVVSLLVVLNGCGE